MKITPARGPPPPEFLDIACYTLPMMDDTIRQNPTPAALSIPQLNAIAAIAYGSTYTAAAAEAGVHRSTLYDWLAQPAFSAELDRTRAEIAATFHDEILQLTAMSLATLKDLLGNSSTPPAIRLRTALTILQRYYRPAATPHPTQSDTLSTAAHPTKPDTPTTAAQTPRNASCPCRSGKKFKRCCGSEAPPVLHSRAA